MNKAGFILILLCLCSYASFSEAQHHTSFDSIAQHPEASKLFWESSISGTDTSAEQFRGLAASQFYLSNYESAISYASAALKKHKASAEPELVYAYYSIIGKSMLNTAQYAEGYQYSLDYTKLAIDHSDTAHILKANLLQAALLYYLGRRDDSYQMQWKVFNLAKRHGDSTIASLAARNMTARCSELHRVDSALYWFKTSRQFDPVKDPTNTAMAYALASVALLDEKYYSRRQSMLDTAMYFAQLSEDTSTQAFVSIKQAEFYLIQDRLDEARTHAQRAVDIYTSLKVVDGITHALSTIVAVNEREKNPEKALEGLRYITKINNTIYSIETAQKMAEFETKFNTSEKERENLVLKKENAEKELSLLSERAMKNLILLIASFVLLLVVVIAIFIFYSNKQKQQRQMVEMEQQRLKSTVLAQDKERKRIAKELHDGVSQSLASIKLNLEFQLLKNEKQGKLDADEIEKLAENVGHLQREVRAISHAMIPHALAENGLIGAIDQLLDASLTSKQIRYNFKHSLPQQLSDFVEIEIFRMLQELIANALKHSECTKLKIDLKAENNHLKLVVEDNGKGMDLTRQSDGIGLKNLKARAESLKGEIHWEKSEMGGVKTIFSLKLIAL